MLLAVLNSWHPCERVSIYEGNNEEGGKLVFRGVKWGRLAQKAGWSMGGASISCALIIIYVLASKGQLPSNLYNDGVAIVGLLTSGLTIAYTFTWGSKLFIEAVLKKNTWCDCFDDTIDFTHRRGDTSADEHEVTD